MSKILCVVDVETILGQFSGVTASEVEAAVETVTPAGYTLWVVGGQQSQALVRELGSLGYKTINSMVEAVFELSGQGAAGFTEARLFTASDLSPMVKRLIDNEWIASMYSANPDHRTSGVSHSVPLMLLPPGLFSVAAEPDLGIKEMADTTPTGPKKEISAPTAARRNEDMAHEYKSLEAAINADRLPATGVFDLDEITKGRKK